MKVGTIGWHDLTVPDAERVRDFYAGVVGWRAEPVDMGGYSDFNMVEPTSGESVAGVCHARGTNADLPPQWLVYVVVSSVEASVARSRELGGEVVVAPRGIAGGRFAVVRDPAGAVLGVYEPARPEP